MLMYRYVIKHQSAIKRKKKTEKECRGCLDDSSCILLDSFSLFCLTPVSPWLWGHITGSLNGYPGRPILSPVVWHFIWIHRRVELWSWWDCCRFLSALGLNKVVRAWHRPEDGWHLQDKGDPGWTVLYRKGVEEDKNKHWAWPTLASTFPVTGQELREIWGQDKASLKWKYYGIFSPWEWPIKGGRKWWARSGNKTPRRRWEGDPVQRGGFVLGADRRQSAWDKTCVWCIL